MARWNNNKTDTEDRAKDAPGKSASGAVGSGAQKWSKRRRVRPERPNLLADDPAEKVADISCPKCGKPMLPEWGATCPDCRPKIAGPKTMMMSLSEIRKATPMALGWLVVIRSPEEGRVGELLRLEGASTVLTRKGAGGANDWIAFDDQFMSAGHAVITRPALLSEQSAFTVQDRPSGTPTANGTFVNSRKLAPNEVVSLSDGDVIRVGTTELQFKSLLLSGGIS